MLTAVITLFVFQPSILLNACHLLALSLLLLMATITLFMGDGGKESIALRKAGLPTIENAQSSKSVLNSVNEQDVLQSLVDSIPEWFKTDVFVRIPRWDMVPGHIITMEFAHMNVCVFTAMLAVCFLILFIIVFMIVRFTRPSSVNNTVLKWLGITFSYIGVFTVFSNALLTVTHCTPSLVKLGSIADTLLAKGANPLLTNYSNAIYTVISVTIVKLILLFIGLIIVIMVVLPYFSKKAGNVKYGYIAIICLLVVVIMYVGDTSTESPIAYEALFDSYVYVAGKMSISMIIAVLSIIILIALRAMKKDNETVEIAFKIIFVISFLMTINCLVCFYFNYIPIDLGYVLDSHNLEMQAKLEEIRIQELSEAYLKNYNKTRT